MAGKHARREAAGRWPHRLLVLMSLMAVATAGTGAGTSTASSLLPAAPMVVTESDGEIRHDGYVAVDDGTLLRVQVDRPDIAEQVPTLLVYQGYTHQIDAALDPRAGLQKWATDNGYALMFAVTRGTGCSAGAWDFLAEQEARDAEDLISWVIAQPWSNDKVAMIGESYAGFEQLRVASRKPEGLVAVAPAAPFTDLYRDVVAPGGIPNAHVPVAFTGAVALPLIMTSPGWRPDPPELAAYCDAHTAEHLMTPAGTPAALLGTRRWDDEVLRERSPGRDDVALPMLALVSWQDEQLGSRAIDSLARMSGPVHAVVTNGGHSSTWLSARFQQELRAFLDFYVKGIDAGFSERAPVQVWWETERREPFGDAPAWIDRLPRLPAPSARTTELYLSQGGALGGEPGTGSPDSYLAEPGSGQARGHSLYPNPWPDWSAPAGGGRSLAYTSGPLDKDLTALGSGSLDLWLESSQPDTDVQVVLTELRPDGQEVYVQAGWLRASHRTEDLQQSGPTRPFHTHREADALALTPGTPELLRVEIPPFGHVFRAGSAVRIWIEAPAKTFGARSLEPLPYSSDNAVHHDAQHPSVLRLSTLAGRSAPVGHPECGTILAQPCRADPLAAQP